MKNWFKILFFIFFTGCGTVSYNNIVKNPDIHESYSDFLLGWDGKTPVKEYVATIKLNEPIRGIDGRTVYVLETYDMYEDSTFILRMISFE